MYRPTYQTRIRRIEKARNPSKYNVYRVDLCDDGYIVKNTITGAVKHMDKIDYKIWEKTLTGNDVVIIDNVK